MSFIEIEKREKNNRVAVSELHSHNYYEIYCLLSGRRDFFLEGRVYDLDEKSICIVPPFKMHKSDGGAYKRINFYISTDILDSSEERFLESNAGGIRLEPGSRNEELFFKLLEYAAEGSPSSNEVKYQLPLAKSLLSILMKSRIFPKAEQSSLAKSSGDDGFVLEIVAYLNENYLEKISLAEICDLFFISKNTLCKKFSSVMRCSVMEYCQRLRINKAKTLLLSSGKSIDEIAGLCGYSSANYFSLIFAKKVGLSPLNYRRKK